MRRLEDAGAAAIVMHSLFEEQIVARAGGDDGHRTLDSTGLLLRRSDLSYLPEPESFNLGP